MNPSETTTNPKLIYEEEGFRILGACFEVYKTMGKGFLEAVYQECLEIEFQSRNIPFITHPVLELKYKDRILNQSYVADFICYDKILLELKAVSNLTKEHSAQLQNYLSATGIKVGYLINFGHYPLVEYLRYVN